MGFIMVYNDMTYSEITCILSELGITDIADSLIKDLEAQWSEMPPFARESLNKLTMLLALLGDGSYDSRTLTWTPSSACVYSFDMEAMDMPNMYKNLFSGIAAISGGELEFCEISQYETVDRTAREISFTLNGQKYSFMTDRCDDWYDVRIFNLLNKALAEQNMPKKLYFTTDGYQQFIVLYNDEDWANRFMQVTGCEIHDEIC